MTGHKTCGALMALMLFSFSASPAQAQYGGWWNRWFGTSATTTYYSPAIAQPALIQPGCGQPACGQVVNYMPQTCYRTVYVNAPVVAYRPVTACDPCTGCPTTVMRPVTSFATQARLVPYMTYRPVVTAGYAPVVPACATCAPAAAPMARPAYYAPSVPMAAPVTPTAPACCGASAATAPTLNYAPTGAPGATVSSLAPTGAYYQAPGAVGAQPYGAFTPNLPPQGAPPITAPSSTTPSTDDSQNRTFQEPALPSAPEPQSRMLTPIPGTNSNTSGAPRFLDSEDQDRSTALPVRQALAARQVSVAMPIKQLDDSGWRAARN